MFSLFSIVIKVNPQNVTTAVGRTVSLSCSASGVNDATYEWMRKGKMIPPKAKGSNTNELVIPNIQTSNRGDYRCTASSGNVSVNSEFGTVSVLGELDYTVYIYAW